MSNQVPRMDLNPGEHRATMDARLRSWRSEEVGRRVWINLGGDTAGGLRQLLRMTSK
jgi:hypothetical protein